MERKREKKIGWLELFYDLVYVAAISQLTHHLAQHPSWHPLCYSCLLFSLVFWSWVNGSSIMICMAIKAYVQDF
ncbi:MAG TPA: low temperature requirement protein A [Bacteroidia bacterium]|nr:low temperature requirement protein A [Bacteroidia bacterium]